MHGSQPKRGPENPPASPAAARLQRGGIATRLLWSYLVSSTVPLLLVGALLLNIGLFTQRENVYNEQRNLANSISRNVVLYIGNFVRQFGTYQAIVRPRSTTVDEWRANALELSERNYPNLIDFALLDLQGREQIRVQQLLAVSDDELADHGVEPSFKQTIAQDRPLFLPLEDEQGAKTILIMLPLRNDAGTVIGALRAVVDADPVIEEMRSSTLGTNSSAYLLQMTNNNVAIDDGQPNFTPPPDPIALLGAIGTAQEYTGARGLQVVGSVSPVVLPDGTPTQWAVVAEQLSAVAFADLRRSIWVLALVVILVDGAVLIWAVRQARQFTEPLRALRGGAVLIGDGHLDHRISIASKDELGDVANAFNQMAGHLQQSLDEIERQNERLRHGLALARDIQLGLLPDRAPWGNEEIAVYARSIPAYEVGGDFYTYVALSEGRAAIAIGDISGKGVGAALLMSLTSSAVESHGRELEHPAEVLTSLNKLLAPRLKANHMNAAIMFVVFDPRERQLRAANAGMIAPILINAEGSTFLDVGGLPIGAFSGAIYRDLSIPIQPGDMVLLVSDGVVEAHNEHGEMFGFERLEALLSDARAVGDVHGLVELVLSRVQEFIGEAEQHDDITLVAVRPAFTLETPAFDDQEQASPYATV